MPAKKIEFNDNVESRLEYYIQGSAIEVDQTEDLVKFRIYNSRKFRTPGYIQIPKDSLPELITELTNIYNEKITKEI